ncbi:MBL fold metallo-hydrolase [Amycolatopsis benzoatilytica]|uniref:MBL fold metallo-hydrolase n=1 Tax=Amycolatopsis benzoatilytica TaxID=346045 RepID=UPI00035C2E2B|nr:MBL fold metallo-hydrolase [Amycolatopsis benzoatilytica]
MTTRVVLLGTAAGPYPAPGRQGCANAVVVGGRAYLVDAGYRTLGKYVSAGLSLRDLSAVFVTHLHSDHVAELFTLFLLGWGPANEGIVDPVRVYGPGPDPTDPGPPAAGTEALVAGCLTAFGQDVAVRQRTSSRPPLAGLIHARDLEVAPGAELVVHEDDRVRVTARAVPHPPLRLALGYRFETEDGVVAFSGDTARSDAVGELAADADLLVHEAMEPDFYRSIGYSPRLLEFLAASHTSPADVGRVAAAAGARQVALSHLGPADPAKLSDEGWLSRVRPHYSGPVVVGHDLLDLTVGN